MNMGRIMISAVAALSLVACNGDKDGTGTDTGASTGGDGGACITEVVPGYPTNGAADFYYLSALDAAIADGTGVETMSLADAAGADVAGTSALSADGTTVTFTPSAALTANTEYTVTVTTCQAEASTYGFATSSLGTPTDGCDLTGRKFVVDLQNARFLEPAGVAELLLGQLEDDIMLSATSVSDTSIEMIGALGQGGVQDECTESLNDFPAAVYADPHFELGPQDTPLGVAGIELVINDLFISGDFASDCSGFGGGTLAGQLDARTLAPLLGDLLGITDPDEVCATLTGFGVTCGACSDGADYCVDVLVDQLNATAQDGSLTKLETADVEGNPDCADD
jgi:hypothetical protein